MEYYTDFTEFAAALRTQIKRDLQQFNDGQSRGELEFVDEPGYRGRRWTLSIKGQPPTTWTQLRVFAPWGEVEIRLPGIHDPLVVTLDWTSRPDYCRPLLEGTPTTVALLSQHVLSAYQ